MKFFPDPKQGDNIPLSLPYAHVWKSVGKLKMIILIKNDISFKMPR